MFSDLLVFVWLMCHAFGACDTGTEAAGAALAGGGAQGALHCPVSQCIGALVVLLCTLGEAAGRAALVRIFLSLQVSV